jgi:hypothetical protein
MEDFIHGSSTQMHHPCDKYQDIQSLCMIARKYPFYEEFEKSQNKKIFVPSRKIASRHSHCPTTLHIPNFQRGKN